MPNKNSLFYWKHRTYSHDELLNFASKYDDKYSFALLEFSPERNLKVTISRSASACGGMHSPAIIRYFNDVLHSWKGPETLNGSLIVWLDDGLYSYLAYFAHSIPILTYCRHSSDYASFLIPDPAYLNSEGYREELVQIEEQDRQIAWDDRLPTIFWRGANSGLGGNGPDWKEMARMRLVLKAKELNRPEIVNAKISKSVVYGDIDHSEELKALGVLGEYVPFSEFMNYKYLVDADGISCAWISLYWKLFTRSTVLKIHSEYSQWYYSLLRPWYHYIPVLPRIENIEEIWKQLGENDSLAKQIGENGKEFIKSLDFNTTLRDTGECLSSIFQSQRR